MKVKAINEVTLDFQAEAATRDLPVLQLPALPHSLTQLSMN